jgi:HlyD family secretion protein
VGIAAYLMLMPREETYTVSSYETAVVVRGDMVRRTQASGTVVVPEQLTVTAPDVGGGEGYAAELYVSEGSIVDRGAPLARIDVPELEEDLAETEADLADATLNLEQLVTQNEFAIARAEREIARTTEDVADAEAEVARLTELVAVNASRQSELASAEQALEDIRESLGELQISLEEDRTLNKLAERSRQATVDRYRRQISRLEADLAAAMIRSPLSGEVLEVADTLALAGSPITKGESLFTVADRTSAVVELEVPEQYSGVLQPGQEVALSVGGVSLSGTIDTVGKVATMSSDGLGATVLVTVLPEPGADLLPGSSAVSELVVGVDEDVLKLPRGPYLTTGSQRYLFVVEGDRAVRTAVTYGTIQTDEVQIAAGVEEGATVIVSGYQNFVEYEAVRLGGSK